MVANTYYRKIEFVLLENQNLTLQVFLETEDRNEKPKCRGKQINGDHK